MIDCSRWSGAINEFADWLDAASCPAAVAWSGRLNSATDADVEGAIAEAVCWDFLRRWVDHVELNEDLTHGGPDFLCRRGGATFLVEVTNIATATATVRTTIGEELKLGGQYVGTLTTQLDAEVKAKAGKRSFRDLPHPLVVMVTTLHTQASRLCVTKEDTESLLMSETVFQFTIDSQTGDAVGPGSSVTDLRWAVFARMLAVVDASGAPVIEPTRQHISAVVVAGFGFEEPKVNVFGAIHPVPRRAFTPEMLPTVPFCQYETWPIQWPARVAWSIASAGRAKLSVLPRVGGSTPFRR